VADGEKSANDAVAAMNAGLNGKVDLIDTSDVHGDGRSERINARVFANRSDPRPFVATKAGQRIDLHVTEN
jgi:aryl-alcohol dehydrogenase-like predicted oxidoreductase